MGRKAPKVRRRVLRLPDLDHSRPIVLNSLGSPASRRAFEFALNEFIAWYCSEPRLAFNRTVVLRYRLNPEARGLGLECHNRSFRDTTRAHPSGTGPISTERGLPWPRILVSPSPR